MTLTFNQIWHFFLAPSGRGGETIARLDALRLSRHDLADLNLPPELRLRIENVRDAGKIIARW